MRREKPYLFLQAAPAKYINEVGIVKKSSKYIKEFGNKVLISGGVRALKSAEGKLVNSLKQSDIEWDKHIFTGECCNKNIDLIKDKAVDFSADAIIGIGGGKSIDAAKAAAEELNLPIITIPTIAATCASTTAVSIIYSEEGEYLTDFYLKTNPNLVLVDPEIISEAPDKYLRAGIFDALSKWYEGKAALKGIDNPDIYTTSAIKLASMLNEEMELKAKVALDLTKHNKVKKELIDVIDLNIYITGMIQSLGMATCRGAAAHAVHNGLTLIPESHDLLHGIKVGYGIIVQLFLEDLPQKEINKVINFFDELGLKISFKSLGLPFQDDLIEKVALKSANDPIMEKMPFEINFQLVKQAIIQLESHMEDYYNLEQNKS